MKHRYPGVFQGVPDDWTAFSEPGSGYIEADEALEAYKNIAEESGNFELHENCEIVDWTTNDHHGSWDPDEKPITVTTADGRLFH